MQAAIWLTNHLAAVFFMVQKTFGQTCSGDLIACEFQLPLNSIVHAVVSPTSGISQLECVQKMQQFLWPVGIYCESSRFCGLGLDTKIDFALFKSLVKIEPVSDICQVFTRLNKIQCEDLMTILLNNGIVKRES